MSLQNRVDPWGQLHAVAERGTMLGNRGGKFYTSLFFLDAVTALAAGHRPCFDCRRKDAKAFLGDQKVEAFDRQLHTERLNSLTLSFAEQSLEGCTKSLTHRGRLHRHLRGRAVAHGWITPFLTMMLP